MLFIKANINNDYLIFDPQLEFNVIIILMNIKFDNFKVNWFCFVKHVLLNIILMKIKFDKNFKVN